MMWLVQAGPMFKPFSARRWHLSRFYDLWYVNVERPHDFGTKLPKIYVRIRTRVLGMPRFFQMSSAGHPQWAAQASRISSPACVPASSTQPLYREVTIRGPPPCRNRGGANRYASSLALWGVSIQMSDRMSNGMSMHVIECKIKCRKECRWKILKVCESVSLRVQVNALGCQNIWQKKYRVSMSEYMADKL